MERGGDSTTPRVLVVLGNFALNGQERGNIEVARAVRHAGGDVLVASHASWGGRHIQPFLDRLGIPWISVDYARHFTKRMNVWGWAQNIGRTIKASWELGRAIRSFRPTHIHVANPHYVLSVLPALWLSRTPVVYRLGDEPTQHHLFYRVLWRWGIVPRVQTFVCVSEHIRAKAVASGVSRKKTTVIYTHPASRPVGEPKELPHFDGRTVTYVGQIAAHKGVDVFVNAALALCQTRDDVRFLIAGALVRSNPFALALVAKVQAAGRRERIRFLGYVEDVPGLLAASDLHVCPSVGPEALSNTVVEAKQAGVPSVVSGSGGLPELVTQNVDGRVCQTVTAEALAEDIAYYLDLSGADLDAAGQAAHDSMERMGITAEAFTARWASVYGVPDRAVPLEAEGVAAV